MADAVAQSGHGRGDVRGPTTLAGDVGRFLLGDTDTRGFAILNRPRVWLPRTVAVLIDRETLLAHRDRWVIETMPTRASLAHLSTDEAALYQDLVTDHLGDRVRLEQERIDWEWAMKRLPYS